VLSIAKVAVFANGRNVALNQVASQSSTMQSGVAARAVNCNWDGAYSHRSVTHAEAFSDPFQEVDFDASVQVDKIKINNREGGNSLRLKGFRLLLLDLDREVVFSEDNIAVDTIISFK
jgi:hypothetical protein